MILDPTVGAHAEAFLAVATLSDLPAGDEWLSGLERSVLNGLRFAKRRSEWKLGRWGAKVAVQECLSMHGVTIDPMRISIIAGDDGAPRVTWIDEQGDAPTVSISHSHGVGFAAAADVRIGCDVECIAPRSDGFLDSYLTKSECRLVRDRGSDRDRTANLIWSAKEAGLKALRVGLRADTWGVTAHFPDGLDQEDDGNWNPMVVRTSGGAPLIGHWRVSSGFVYTVVTDRSVSMRWASSCEPEVAS